MRNREQIDLAFSFGVETTSREGKVCIGLRGLHTRRRYERMDDSACACCCDWFPFPWGVSYVVAPRRRQATYVDEYLCPNMEPNNLRIRQQLNTNVVLLSYRVAVTTCCDCVFSSGFCKVLSVRDCLLCLPGESWRSMIDRSFV